MRRRTQICAALGLSGLAGLLVTTLPWHDRAAAGDRPGPGAGIQPRYLGNDACAECHRREFVKHKGSRHDITLRPGSPAALGALAPPAGPIEDTGYLISRGGDRFLFAKAGQASPIELAFGSGKTGMTYVAIGSDNRETEFRISRIPSSRSWYITPGQESRADLDLGYVHSHDMTRRCLLCHAITLPQDSARPDPKMLGVGCESCHGPGEAHVAAARIKGNPDVKIERMSRWSARQINELCARCHRSQIDVSLVTRDASSTQRFQPYGLMLSPCFKKSGEKLSCSTCHDVHANVSTDRKSYERVCITCHAGPGANPPPDPRVAKDAIHGKRPCPVNPRSGCIGCHMPATQVFPGSKLPVIMADHMIWAYAKRPRT